MGKGRRGGEKRGQGEGEENLEKKLIGEGEREERDGKRKTKRRWGRWEKVRS